MTFMILKKKKRKKNMAMFVSWPHFILSSRVKCNFRRLDEGMFVFKMHRFFCTNPCSSVSFFRKHFQSIRTHATCYYLIAGSNLLVRTKDRGIRRTEIEFQVIQI